PPLLRSPQRKLKNLNCPAGEENRPEREFGEENMTDRADAVPGVAGGIAPSQGFTPAYRNYALFVLMIAYTANYVDRQILAILLEPIKQDLGLNDTQLGFLSGITFAIFYATLGVPIAM